MGSGMLLRLRPALVVREPAPTRARGTDIELLTIGPADSESIRALQRWYVSTGERYARRSPP